MGHRFCNLYYPSQGVFLSKAEEWRNQRRSAGHGDGGRRSAGHGDGGAEKRWPRFVHGDKGEKGRIFSCLFDGLVNL